MELLSNNEEGLHNFLFRSFKCLSGSTVGMFQKSELKNLSHSLSSSTIHQQGQKQVWGPHDLGPGGQGGVC